MSQIQKLSYNFVKFIGVQHGEESYHERENF